MTAASPARIAANRENARRSTGPRSAEGKSRSRANAVRHGLGGAGIALPDDLMAEVEAEYAAVAADLRPRSTLGAFLLRQATIASVRCRRAFRQESAALAHRVRHAAADWDEARHVEADDALRQIADDPAALQRRLLRTPEGTERLIAALEGLGRDLLGSAPGWDAARAARLEALQGIDAERLPLSPTAGFARAALGDYRGLDPDRLTRVGTAEAIRPWAIARLREIIAAQVAALADHRAAFDPEEIERDRAEAPERALFDPGAAASLARRYEAASSRLFFRSLREFRIAEAEAEHESEAEPDRPIADDPAPSPSCATPASEYVDVAAGRRATDVAATLPEPLGSFGSADAGRADEGGKSSVSRPRALGFARDTTLGGGVATSCQPGGPG